MTDTPAPHYPFLDLGRVNQPFMGDLQQAALRVVRSGRYIGGEEVERLESELAALHQAPFAVAVANGLDALRLSLRAAVITGRLREGDKVMVPANTYIASILAITDAGLAPLLVDPDEHTMCLTGEIVAGHITPDVKALMPVHLYGRVAWDTLMAETAMRHDLWVIEDGAQSIGATAAVPGLYSSRRSAALGHAGALSFYPTKNVGALGDAGAVITHDPELARTVRALANYGCDRRYHNILQGFNSRLDPIQAAMLRVKLHYLESINADRFALATAYHNTIDNPRVTKPVMSGSVTDCVWHQYVIGCEHRDELRAYLAAHGVETDIHYPIPPHMQPCYCDLPHGSLPITESLAGRIISLPITPGCTSVSDAAAISQIINQFNP